MFFLNPQSSTPLVVQIVEGFRLAIQAGSLRAGSKAPSIRQFAHAHDVSVFTVVDAYDRLVAQGYFASRPHSGFFVKQRPVSDEAVSGHGPNFSFDSMWYLRRIFENRAPDDWLFQEGVRRSLRSLTADNVDLGGYGEPKGYPPLRQIVRDLLAEQEIAVTSEQVLLTHGSSQAMDLVARRLVRPGDAVLVDDPVIPTCFSRCGFWVRAWSACHAPRQATIWRCSSNWLLSSSPKSSSPSRGYRVPRDR